MFRGRAIPLSLGLCCLLLASATLIAQVRVQVGRPAPNAANEDTKPVSSAKALKEAGLDETDPAGLIEYLKLRSLSDGDLDKIRQVIERFGADDFEERLAATYEAEKFGPAAVGPLRAAAKSDSDPEIAYRAEETLSRLEKVPHSAVALAAVNALAKLQPPETAQVLLDFLPSADDNTVAEAIRQALVKVAVRDGTAEPSLIKALSDGKVERRIAAALALIHGGPTDQLIRIPDAFPKVKETMSKEKDVEAKFEILFALLTTARDKDALEQMIEMIPELPRGRLWQAEDYLLQLAHDDAPKVVIGSSEESLKNAAKVWQEWWAKDNKPLDQFAYVPRISGRTMLIQMDFRFGSVGSVIELGPDMKERWEITGLASPMDAKILPDGRIAVAEHNGNRITFRDTQGNVLSTRTIGGANRVYGNPQQLELLDNGNLLVICRNLVAEMKLDKDEEVMRYVRNRYDISGATRLPDGKTLLLLQNGPDHCMFIDEKGKEIENTKLKFGMPYYQGYVNKSGPDRVLVTEMNQVAEYDLKENKRIWSLPTNQPRSVQRLPNGNTLYVDASNNRLVEVTPEKEEVWTYRPETGLNIFRAFRY